MNKEPSVAMPEVSSSEVDDEDNEISDDARDSTLERDEENGKIDFDRPTLTRYVFNIFNQLILF